MRYDGVTAAACGDSKLDPIFEFDQTGKLPHNFGGALDGRIQDEWLLA